MAVRNKVCRRLILEALFNHGAMTRTEMFDHLNKHHNLLRENTEHSIGSLMFKSSQIIETDTVVSFTDSGNKVILKKMDIDRSVIKTTEDLVMSMPNGLLTKAELKKYEIGRCPTCARQRILETHECLECNRRGL